MQEKYQRFEKQLLGLGLRIDQGTTLENFLDMTPGERKRFEDELRGEGSQEDFIAALREELTPKIIQIEEDASQYIPLRPLEEILCLGRNSLLTKIVSFEKKGSRDVPLARAQDFIEIRYSGLTCREMTYLLSQSKVEVRADSLHQRVRNRPYQSRKLGRTVIVDFADAYFLLERYYIEKTYFTPNDVRRLFGVTHTTVARWREQGLIQGIKTSNRNYCYSPSEIVSLKRKADSELTMPQLHLYLAQIGMEMSHSTLFRKLYQSGYDCDTSLGRKGIKFDDLPAFLKSIGVKKVIKPRQKLIEDEVSGPLYIKAEFDPQSVGPVSSLNDLTAEQQKQLLFQAKNGGERAFAIIANVYQKMIENLATKVYVANSAKRDRINWAKLGLYNAVNTYDFREDFLVHAQESVIATLKQINSEESSKGFYQKDNKKRRSRRKTKSLGGRKQLLSIGQIKNVIQKRELEEFLTEEQQKIYHADVPDDASYSVLMAGAGLSYHRVEIALREMRELALKNLFHRVGDKKK